MLLTLIDHIDRAYQHVSRSLPANTTQRPNAGVMLASVIDAGPALPQHYPACRAGADSYMCDGAVTQWGNAG